MNLNERIAEPYFPYGGGGEGVRGEGFSGRQLISS